MKKRILIISVLLGLACLITALSPFVQTDTDTALPVTPDEAQESGLSDCAGEDICSHPHPVPAQSSLGTLLQEAAYDTLHELSGFSDTESDSSETDVPSSDDEQIIELTTDSDPENEDSVDEKIDTADPAPDEFRSSPSKAASWHMTFNVDCVSTGCIALSDTSAGMYVSACNDGGGEYGFVEFTPVDQQGKFIGYFTTPGDTPDIGNSGGNNIDNPTSTFAYGPLSPHNCVTAIFESEFDDPPSDYTQFRRFKFNLDAYDGNQIQSTSAYADKYGCYAPSGSGIGITVKDNNECVEPDALSASYEFRISNTGNSDICGLTLSADKPGSFRLKNSEIMRSGSGSSTPFEYSGIIFTDDYISVIFDEDLSNAALTPGGQHTVTVTATGGQCIIKSSASAQATATARIEICHEPEPPAEPDIQLDITAPSDCSDPGSDDPDRFTVTVTNTGETDLCKVEAEGPAGSVVLSIGGQNVTNGTNKAVTGVIGQGESVEIIFGYKPSAVTGNTYSVSFSAKGYVDENGACTEGVTAEASADMEICEPEPVADLDLDLTAPSDCSVPGSDIPDEFKISITNIGDADLCKVVVSGPAGTVFSGDGNTAGDNSFIIEGLRPGQTSPITVLFKGNSVNESYMASFKAEGYAENGSICSEMPAVTAEAEAEVPVCETTPEIDAEIDASAECHVYTGDSIPDRFDYQIKNTGDAEYCMVTAQFDIIAGGTVVRSETIEVDAAALSPGSVVNRIYEIVPEEIPGIQPGGTYSVRVTAYASVSDGTQACPSDPIVSAQDDAEKQVCPVVKPVITVYNMNPACIDAGDTLKFKGLIDIDSRSAAERITVNTGEISWGGTKYACDIVSVKNSAHSDFADLTDEEKGTSYEFLDFGSGEGAVGFICEAKTSDNEQMRNSRSLSFSAEAVISPAGSLPAYRISSNTADASQHCVYTHTTLLPYTGDNGSMPVLVGLFSLFLICGGASSFVLLRRKKTTPKQDETTELE